MGFLGLAGPVDGFVGAEDQDEDAAADGGREEEKRRERLDGGLHFFDGVKVVSEKVATVYVLKDRFTVVPWTEMLKLEEASGRVGSKTGGSSATARALRPLTLATR
jgi:hypothetical protein